MPRVRALAEEAEPQAPGNLEWLHPLADSVIGSVGSIEGADVVSAQFFNNIQTLDVSLSRTMFGLVSEHMRRLHCSRFGLT